MQSIVQNIKRESLRGFGRMDKAMRETSPLECHLNIQWGWNGNLGKIQILSKSCGEQTH